MYIYYFVVWIKTNRFHSIIQILQHLFVWKMFKIYPFASVMDFNLSLVWFWSCRFSKVYPGCPSRHFISLFGLYGLEAQMASIGWTVHIMQEYHKISISVAVALSMAFEIFLAFFPFSGVPWYPRSSVSCKNHMCNNVSSVVGF